MSDLTLSSLQQIQIKVRRITRSMTEAVLSTSDINNYINSFVLYDIPEHLRLFNLRTTFQFYAKPNIDTYATNTTDPTDPLYNFLNQYITIHTPVYIAGYQSMYSMSQQQFFGIYPKVNNISSIGAQGDGSATTFTGTIAATPILRDEVLFTSVDINGNGLALKDVPTPGLTQGNIIDAYTQTPIVGAFVDYITGAFQITFPTPPAVGQAINSQSVPYTAAQPQACLFYDGVFTLRPVPDQPYTVTFETYKRPTELLNSNQMPELSEWWEWIAYGASRKVFQDRMDNESLSAIENDFREREALAIRRTIVQQTEQRTSTIYTEQTAGLSGLGGLYGGGQF